MMTVADEAGYAAALQYMEAHDALPLGFKGSDDAWCATVEQALAAIADPTRNSQELLRAVVILGHTPTTAALHALRRFAASGHALQGVAAIAVDECMDWLARATHSSASAN